MIYRYITACCQARGEKPACIKGGETGLGHWTCTGCKRPTKVQVLVPQAAGKQKPLEGSV
jgi:hypothetical protein